MNTAVRPKPVVLNSPEEAYFLMTLSFNRRSFAVARTLAAALKPHLLRLTPEQRAITMEIERATGTATTTTGEPT